MLKYAGSLHAAEESSYLINHTPCRLRDISELFMDTGIGVDAYSVMEQSKIDLILNVRPEERRFLFDEVAGITKYKHHKKIVLRKLEATKQNLVRIDDVIQELKRETESLKVQAEQAEHYQSLREQLRQLELGLACREYDKLETEYRETQGKLDTIINVVSDANQFLQESEDRVESATVRKSELDAAISDSKDKISEIAGKIEKIERQIVVYKENQLNITQQRQRALQTLESLDVQQAQIQSRKRERTQEMKQVEAAYKIEVSRLSGRKNVLEDYISRIDRAKVSIQEAQSILQETTTELSVKENQRLTIEHSLTNSQSSLSRLQENSDDLKAELKVVSDDCEKIQHTATLLDSDLIQIDTEKNRVETTLSETGELLRQVETKKRGLQDSLGGSVTQYNTLKQMQSTYRGYYAGVSAIMQAKTHYPEEFGGICGVVAELIQTDNEYEVAIEVALGSAIQNVVTETAEDADSGISFLKKESCWSCNVSTA